ncbi:GNAT family N-acetyltransferase [Runella zeae]|uniref:GNAT family N-acetyltransferase n=1 Tax=Runella zeae TaxID=94255 RepID=UPI00041A65AC|nr:GNAT family N-acetyltransferase [Runella zeae]
MQLRLFDSQIYPVFPEDYQEIVEVWEASVRATHHFLLESDIQYFKPLILNEFLKAVTLFCIKDNSGAIVGFMGLHEDSLEMLFIHPDMRGKGIGKLLLQRAIGLGIRKVDVNEQNPDALGFYQSQGFEVVSRSPLDGLGKPYPILHLQLP